MVVIAQGIEARTVMIDAWRSPGIARYLMAGILLLSIVLFFRPETARAEEPALNTPFPIYVAGSDNQTFNQYFIKLLQDRLGADYRIAPMSEVEDSSRISTPVVALSASALSRVMDLSASPPVIAVMVTQRQLAPYQQTTDNQLSAVYGVPPLLRQALLGQSILPHSSRVAILAEQDHVGDYSELIETLSHYDLEARVFPVSSTSRLVATLNRALRYGDYLLGTPDPAVFNRQTIKPILLTTYRHGRVLIGPEKAFVRAGALASTYTPTPVFADEVIERIRIYRQEGRLPPADYPRQFEISYNRQVARSLNIPLPDKDEVKERIRRDTDRDDGEEP